MRLRFLDCVFDSGTREVFRNGRPSTISPKAFQFLEILIGRRPNAVSKEQLHEHLWPNTFVADANLPSLAAELRAGLGDDARSPRMIRTVPRFGYAFCAEVVPDGPESTTAPAEVAEIPPRSIRSIAVLPFASLSADPDTEYLADGISEGIIRSLSRLSNLRVMAHTTLSRYKGRKVDSQVVGEELKVRAVLTGRVFHRGDSLVIKTELVDVRDGSQIWGENYNRKFVDILALEEEISREISAKLRVKVTGEDAQRLKRRETENTEAYRLCLKGRFYWNKRTPDGLRKSIEHFNLAIEQDPEYAMAYAGVADCYNNLGFYGIVAPGDSFPKAKAAAMRALAIDDSLAGARAALGYALLYYDWDWDGAERELRRAIELSPNYPTAHQYYGMLLTWAGRAEVAIAETSRALELDPLSLIISAALGYSLHVARRHEDAAVQLRKTLDMDPTFVPAHLFLGYVYLQVGLHLEAIRQFREVMRLAEDSPIAYAELGCAYASSGRRTDAEEVLNGLEKVSKRRFVSPYCFAILHTALGATDSAFADLEKALTLRAHEMTFLLVEPQLDSLRSDPRFGDLLQRIGL